MDNTSTTNSHSTNRLVGRTRADTMNNVGCVLEYLGSFDHDKEAVSAEKREEVSHV